MRKKKGKKKNNKVCGGVKLSTDPQSVAARERRHRISERFKILQSLVPGGAKMDTVSMLEEAIHYVKFLKAQIWLHQTIINHNNHHDLLLDYDDDVALAPAAPTIHNNNSMYLSTPPDHHNHLINHYNRVYATPQNDYHGSSTTTTTTTTVVPLPPPPPADVIMPYPPPPLPHQDYYSCFQNQDTMSFNNHDFINY
ncbi:hypothetical protein G4B88_001597 [Cannabis sativa]|uniref:BHLH domain-containing protein n=1 Tax=Cannabis sativa TaxID=3483 RepID=A0A7J6I1K1_CANSA|nr:hypothetical protein G4B88_001597 [Cannabis sativa]